MCVYSSDSPDLAAITAQQSRIKHSENINYKALQNNRRQREETVIEEKKSFMLAVTE